MIEGDRDWEQERLERNVKLAVAELLKYMRGAAFKLPLDDSQQVVAGTGDDIRGLLLGA